MAAEELALKRKLIAMLAQGSDDDDDDDDDEDGEDGSDEGDSDDGDDGASGSDDAPPSLPEFEDAKSNRPAGARGYDLKFRSCERALALSQPKLQQLRRDCTLIFPLNSSSWIGCGDAPRCDLERLALAVFAAHTRGVEYDASRSGAEFWAQVRADGHAQEAVQFHWDVDEHCCDELGVNVQPHLSTVTYLTDAGAPTVVLGVPAPRAVADEENVYGTIPTAHVSWPRVGKHICFDGALLHGTLPEAKAAAAPAAAGPRVTFLVNVWLGWRPHGIRPLDAALAEKMSGSGGGDGAAASSAAADADAISALGRLQADAPAPATHVTAANERGQLLTLKFGRQKKEHAIRLPLPDGLAPTADGATTTVELEFEPPWQRASSIRGAAELCAAEP
jgi:hypothetical protein